MNKVFIINGSRTPFLKSGTQYADLMSYQLGAFAIKGLLTKTGIDPATIDNVIMGSVVHNMKTPNVAREAALGAGIPSSVPCQTVSQACISANLAIATAYQLIQSGRADIVIAGGMDSTSDTPISFNKPMRKKLFNAQKLKGFWDSVKFACTLRPRDFAPEKPAIAEFTTGRTMGYDCELLAARLGVTREEMDRFATRSHLNAHTAWESGQLANEVSKVELPPNFKAIEKDNGVRGDSSIEGMAKLKPAFDKKNGSITAANASFLTDGAACVLLVSEKGAKMLGLKPKAEIIDYAITGSDLDQELLLGPAYAIAKLFKQTTFNFSKIDVFEMHEAFAGQVLANLKGLSDKDFSSKYLKQDIEIVGVPNMDKINLWGGSLAIGHPFGATGARLVTTAINRLHYEKGEYALIAACAAGAHGHAMLIKKVIGD